jgi:hypothetical protein
MIFLRSKTLPPELDEKLVARLTPYQVARLKEDPNDSAQVNQSTFAQIE